MPLKALPEEKYETFRDLGDSKEMNVAISTPDHRMHEKAVINGNFGICVMVYEKFFAFLQSKDEFLNQFGLIVLDELQLINDLNRGPLIEIILTKFRSMEDGPQILGLSAVLPASSTFPSWLGIPVLREEKRPIELRLGYLHKGDFHYWSGDNHKKQVEEGFVNNWLSEKKRLVHAVTELVERDEQCIAFVEDRKSTREQAVMATKILGFAPDDEGIKLLEQEEESNSRDELISVMQSGVAFHNADLLPVERKVVEESFRAGRLKAIFATTTLPMGVNLPAKNVFLPWEKWTSSFDSNQPYKTHLSNSDILNMGGRAGRLHLNDDYGRAISIAHTMINCEQYEFAMRSFEPEEFKPQLNNFDNATAAMMILGMGVAHDKQELIDFLSNSYSATFQQSTQVNERSKKKFEESVDQLLKWELAVQDASDTLRLTDIGKVAVQNGLRANTARFFAWAVKDYFIQRPSVRDAAFIALATHEGIAQAARMSKNDYKLKGNTYHQEVIPDIGSDVFKDIQFMAAIGVDDYGWTRICKTSLLMGNFVSGHDNKALEQYYDVNFGEIVRVAEQIAWLLGAASDIAGKLEKHSPLKDSLASLATQIRHGIPKDGLFLKNMNIRGLGRQRVHQLVRFGVSSMDTLTEVQYDDLKWMTGESVAKRLQRKIRSYEEKKANQKEKSESNNPKLTLTGRSRNRRTAILIDGTPKHLRDRDFELLLRLAYDLHEKKNEGWVNKRKLGLPEGSITQSISRLRDSLREFSGEEDGWIESDLNGHYRLLLDPEDIQMDHSALKQFWSDVIDELAA
ncbi:DEAD/DEAH box helicase [bacterium]|nr:DEAD/DEAH box helicase [bacterium]